MTARESPLLEVRNLKKHYPITQGMLKREVGRVRAVDGIDFEVYPGETFGIVGESGCGKSTAATTLLRLEEPTDGEVLFDGTDISNLAKGDLKRFRRRAQMIFQDPSSSFDPRMSVGESIGEPLQIHGFSDREARRQIAQNLLERVGLSASDVDRYPHEFSGGQKQRIGLARALVLNPDLIVADEPVSALDVSIQAEILSLMNSLQAEFNLAIVIISHNLSVIREVCDRMAVMYLGEIVEMGPTEAIFSNPQHPYTRALLSSIPTPDPRQRGMGVRLSGDVPSPSNPPSGCRFHTRCPEIIQPDDVNLEQPAWRSVMDLKQKVRNRTIDLESIRDHAVRTTGDETDDSTATTAAAIRSAFDIPSRLSDPAAESTLETALERLAAGNLEGAGDALSATFRTPCESDKPPLEPGEAGWVVSCHLREENGRAETPNPVAPKSE
ncbi:ABC transporter ATP-binding protein [Haloferacaceae archaeon DSL9]